MRILTLFLLTILFTGCSKLTNNEKVALFPIKEFGKWGFINDKGTIVIKCQFDWAGEFSEGLAPIRKDSLLGFIDVSGRIVIQPTFLEVDKFSDGLCKVSFKNGSNFTKSFIDKTGKVAFEYSYHDITRFYCNRVKVVIEDTICYLDKTGKIIIKTKYPYGYESDFSDGIAVVRDTGWVRYYYDTLGNELKHLNGKGLSKFSDGLILARDNDSLCYIDISGKVVLKLKDQELMYGDFTNGVASITKTGTDFRKGYIDRSGKILVPITQHNTYDYSDRLRPFEEDNKFGFLNLDGKLVIPVQFDWVEYEGFKNGLCKVSKDKQSGYINRNGEFIWKSSQAVWYDKTEMSKWTIDTLTLNEPLLTSQDAQGENYPRKRKYQQYDSLVIKLDTTDLTVFADKYYANKLYLINASGNEVKLPVQDGIIGLIQQARNTQGEWQDIENTFNSWCGVSYYDITLLADEYQIFPIPIYNGNFKTTLRVKLILRDKTIYSNTFTGRIDKGQFADSRKKDNRGISIRTTSF